MGKASKDKRDVYYRRAKEEGYRARSAYKLLQVLDQAPLLDGVQNAVDLCAAPGSWSQVLAARLPQGTSTIVSVDLQEMAPIPGVICIQGDITRQDTAQEIVRHFQGGKADIVVCDGAPDVTGLHELDEYLQHELLFAAANISTCLLRPGGSFIAKMFRGKSTPLLTSKLRTFFRHVVVMKPRASRTSSMESFVVGMGFDLPSNYSPTVNVAELQSQPLPFIPYIVCGDMSSYDADMSYAADGPSLDPVAPPIPLKPME
eukprot:PhF_6_TR19744/c0_g1_i1/m.28810/K14864/FTSJ1, TRM7; tRNA (cytidine32/guanosine34-2'-O)-methyltransferase